MELEITNKQGTFEIIGNFTGKNTQKVKEQFNYLLDHYEEVILSLKKVTNIDKKATRVLQEIYDKATRRSKILFVLGKDNEQVSSMLQQTQTTHIFRNDY